MPPNEVLWLEQALDVDPGRPCPPLTGRHRVDVCIVGGGYTGLWTALELRARAPDLTILVIERAGCGFGPSGRNGGWAVGWHNRLPELERTFGIDAALRLAEQASLAVTRVGEAAGDLGIDCHYRRAGAFYAASAPAQDEAWSEAVTACARHGRAERFHPLAAAELRHRTGSPVLRGGAIQADTATVHPGHLVRGLRRAALERGVTIAEGTPLLRLHRTAPARLETPAALVTADQVVLAMGAWAASVRELRRAILPLTSHIVATAPAPDELAALGWTGGEAVSDFADLVHYAQVTRDRRVVFGRGGGALAASVTPAHFRDARWSRIVAYDLRRWFPALADVPITHSWAGPIDHAAGRFPFVGVLGDHANVHYGNGYSGDGVAQSTLVAGILAGRVLGESDNPDWAALARGPQALFPPEPLRASAGRAVQEAVLRAEVAETAGRRPTRAAALLRRLSHAAVPATIDPGLSRLRRTRPHRSGTDESAVSLSSLLRNARSGRDADGSG